MPNVTLAFDEAVKGWTSEFTFLPDAGLSLNNNYYTFHNGRIWRHNSETSDRNTFYGTTSDTTITFVFNEAPTIVKNYKNMGFEGTPSVDDPDGTGKLGWNAVMETNIENGEIGIEDFVTKEGKNYGWIRGENLVNNLPDLKSSAVGGIGQPSDNVVPFVDTDELGEIPFNSLPSSLAPNDFIYSVDGDNEPLLVGIVSSIRRNTIIYTRAGITGDPDNQNMSPTSLEFYLYAKNNNDKSGIIGYYSIVTMTNNKSADDVELFSVNTRAFISNK